MFGLGTQEIVIILVIAFFVFGGKKLPELGRDLGRSIRSFKKGLSDMEDEGKELLSEKTEHNKTQTTPAQQDSQPVVNTAETPDPKAVTK